MANNNLPKTLYQRVLYLIAYPWLWLVYGPIKPGIGLLCYLVWMAFMFAFPKGVAMVGLIAPIFLFLVSMVAGVLLLLDGEVKRYDANER